MIRNAYLKKAEARLEQLGEHVESLREKAASATADVRDLYLRQIEMLQSKADVAREKIRIVRTAGESSWGRLKDGADEAIEELKKAVDSTVQRFRKTGSDKR